MQIREPAQLTDEVGDIAALFKRRLGYDASGGVMKDFVEDIVAQRISCAVLRAINFENAVVGPLALCFLVVFAGMIETWHGMCVWKGATRKHETIQRAHTRRHTYTYTVERCIDARMAAPLIPASSIASRKAHVLPDQINFSCVSDAAVKWQVATRFPITGAASCHFRGNSLSCAGSWKV